MVSQTFDEDRDLSRRARENQGRLIAELKPHYDFIVCGAGASGSVVARRLAENSEAQVLLIEAGGSDDAEAVLDPRSMARQSGQRAGLGVSRRNRTRI